MMTFRLQEWGLASPGVTRAASQNVVLRGHPSKLHLLTYQRSCLNLAKLFQSDPPQTDSQTSLEAVLSRSESRFEADPGPCPPKLSRAAQGVESSMCWRG